MKDNLYIISMKHNIEIFGNDKVYSIIMNGIAKEARINYLELSFKSGGTVPKGIKI